jgi:hypothetical protein
MKLQCIIHGHQYHVARDFPQSHMGIIEMMTEYQCSTCGKTVNKVMKLPRP